ncbi:DNA polymerase II [Comamonas thiooxydans]|uniref:DNA polymerase n=1 Tax=Comamonas thiooxydans TaxID=363952 RepID=A0AA42PZW4_9BURK|nr:DNA polymerase II [Comamonas thiooxydans]MDH1334672.1 DNA polymerase II [Comamonas thiooxydans]MDH1740883.1 DNA polymerase II [Comamonas thiooxydans]MDH1787076.1 DNA polymerase II [Comamonas thiooxydans]
MTSSFVLSPERQGFILTRNWRDTPAGVELEYWLATDSGPLKVLLTAQKSVAFVEVRHREAVEAQLPPLAGAELRELGLKSFQQEPVLGIYARSFRQLRRLARTLQQLGIPLLEADVRPHERYLMERFITAGVTLQGGRTEHATLVNCKLVPAPDFRPVLKVVSLDIETSQHQDLYSIALDGMAERVVFMLGEPTAKPVRTPGFELIHCTTRKAMIDRLNDWFARNDPDVIIGWNVIQFDLRVLQKTADECATPLLLGRERKPIAWRTHPGKQGYLFAPMPGRVVVDGIEALRAAVWSFPSFSLENVAQELLGEGKDIGDEYDKMAEIERRYQLDKPALAAYNIRDCELVLRIFEKAKLLQFAMERAHTTGLQLDQFGGSIAAFSHHYLPRMHRMGYVAPNVGDVQGKSSPGGYVMDSKPGFYDSVVVLDYKSLYPSIIRTFLVDPVGLVEGRHASSSELLIRGPRGTLFSREKHCLPEIVTTLWQARDEAKRTRNEPLSQALKLVMNSFAGVLGASECRFFNPDLISAITLRGHEMVKLTRDLVEERGYEVIYGDTDSIFIWLKRPHTTEEAYAVAAKLARDINAWWIQTLQQEQGLKSFLEIEFDTYYKKFFMPTIRGSDVGSKKRYAGLSVDAAENESMIYRGLEMARSDWTLLARQFQEGLLSRVFQGVPYREFVIEYAHSTLAGKKDDLLIYRKRLRHRLDAYVANVPPQVRAARIADEYNDRVGRPRQYQNGGWIQYVMTRNGPEPLEIRRSRIDYEHYLAKQIKPIADSILIPLGEDFVTLTSSQQELF